MAIEKLNSTTYTSATLGDVKPVVTIGGKTEKFVPNLNMSFHSDEFFFNLNRKDKIVKTETPTETNGKVKLKIGKESDCYYIDESGRFKWDIEFDEKPASNVFTWEIKHKGLEFFYQGELTDEAIARGAIRPDEVVGSYAVYCTKANNKYKTGKVCHIYRPLCIDANGLKRYADLKIDGKTLTITIPQDYMDKCAYPMTLDPTLGYDSIGASAYNPMGSLFPSIKGQAQSSGTITSFRYSAHAAQNVSTKMAIYNSDSDGNPYGHDLVEQVANSASTIDTNTIIASGAKSVVSGNYYAICIASSAGLSLHYDSLTGSARYINASSNPYSGLWPSIGLNHSTVDVEHYSIWIEYTESSGSTGGLLVGASALVGGGVLCGQGNLIN